MTPERWSLIQEKLEVAVALDPGQRAAFLQELGTTDPNLREELESLLAQDSNSGNLLKTSAMLPLAPPSPERDPMIGRRLGPYQVVDLLGVGGMGEVYRAFRADDVYKQQVAIKLVRTGRDSSLVFGRFKNERQILATLDHPNIARLLDGGATQEGVPYLVMELIEGQPIGEYCDSNKLNVSQRLNLFANVCGAVQYAHSRLIVHRDLKPGNILVTAQGQPKLLDFGIAKILDPGVLGEAPAATMTLVRVLTPAYASPEQVKGETITTSSDVYSLGVILYELLTGHHPYRLGGRDMDAISQAVVEFEPEKPSSVIRRVEPSAAPNQPGINPSVVSATREGAPEKLRRRLRGDLDNIVLMALRKEPERRYASAEQFSEDIRRHMENLPVVARKDTAGYRTSKFIVRHKVGVAAGTGVLLTLMAGLGITLREARIARQQTEIARQQRAQSEQRFNDLRQVANSLMFEFHDSIKDLAGATPAKALLIQRSREYLDRLARDARDDASLQQELATAYIKLGDIQGSPRQADLGDAAGARISYGNALGILEPMLPAQPNDHALHLLAASAYTRLASIAPAQQATDLLGKALRIEQDLAARNPGYAKLRQELGNTYEELSLHFGNPYALTYILGARQGLDYANKALQIREQLYRESPNNPGALFDLFEAYHYVADNLWVTGHLDQALANEMKIRSMMVDFIDRNPTNAEAKRLLVTGDGRIAKVLEESGQLSEALVRLEGPSRGIMSLGAADPKNIMVKRQMGTGCNQMGELLLKLGKVDRAIEYHRKAVQLSESVLSADPTNFDSRYRLAASYQALGNALAAKGSTHEAAEDSSKAVEIRRVLVSGDPTDARGRYAFAKNLLHLGNIQARASPGAGLQSYREGIATLEPMVKTDPDNWIMERTLADLYSSSGAVELRMAPSPSASERENPHHPQRSCSLFSQELNLWRDMRQRNVLIAADLPRLRKGEGRLHDCSVTGIPAVPQQ